MKIDFFINCFGTDMEYADLYVMRIRKLCKERGIAINKLVTMSN